MIVTEVGVTPVILIAEITGAGNWVEKVNVAEVLERAGVAVFAETAL